MRKIIVSLFLLLPFLLAAQEVKIAVVNTDAIFNAMPEVSNLESEMAKMRKQFEDEAKTMQDEYNRKYADFTAAGDTLTENIKALRIQEIQDIATRLENFTQMAQESMQKKSVELSTPIQEKIKKAIEEVGSENGYTYIFHNNVALYVGTSAIDATDKVKTKLGLN